MLLLLNGSATGTYTHPPFTLTPQGRTDGVPWTVVRVEESVMQAGPYTEIAELAITPDPTPETPNVVSVTVTTATLQSGWFRFQWDVAAGNPSLFTDPILSPGGAGEGWAPSASDVAALMFGRVTGEYASTIANFTASTRPTLDQVTLMLGLAVDHLTPRVGFDLDVRFTPNARYLATLYTALLLEPGYWSEQQRPDKSAWEQWKILYDDGLEGLLRAIAEAGAGEEVGPVDDEIGGRRPWWWFPSAPNPRQEW